MSDRIAYAFSVSDFVGSGGDGSCTRLRGSSKAASASWFRKPRRNGLAEVARLLKLASDEARELAALFDSAPNAGDELRLH